MNTPLLLTHLETCDRKGYWSQTRERAKLDDVAMLQAGLRAAVLEARRSDWGEVAGEELYGLGADPGLETTHYNVHGEVVHLSCIADLVATAVRKPAERPWQLPPTSSAWHPASFLSPDGLSLRRVVLVSSWNDDRHYSEARSWFSLGEVCNYGLPMQQVVVVLGQRRSGKRHSPWSRGLRHPANKKLRFRKKTDIASGFKDTWLSVWREDFDDISTKDWLQAMLDDGVLQDLCFKVDIPVPDKPARQHIVDMAARKLNLLAGMDELPDPQLTGCSWPVPCLFRVPCHGGREPQKGPFKILD